MKLLYSVLIVVLIQIIWLNPLEAALKSKTSKTLAQDKLVKLYENGVTQIDKEFADNCRNLSEHILKDKFIQLAATPKIKSFKFNLNDFLYKYPFYQRYDLYNDLVAMFSDIVMDYYYRKPNNDSESQYIYKLLKQHGYDEINTKYERKFEKFIKEKLVIEFENFTKTLAPTDKLREHLSEWSKEIKQCQKYDCYDEDFDKLLNILYTPKDELFDAIEDNLDTINITYIIKANDVMKSIINDTKLKQLNPALQSNLTRDVNYFINQYNTNTDIDKLDDIFAHFQHNISIKYYNNTRLPVKDHKLLKDIFDKHGYAKMHKFNEHLLNDFIQHELYNIFEEYKATLNHEELANEKPLFQWYEYVKRLKTLKAKVKAFDQLLAMKEK